MAEDLKNNLLTGENWIRLLYMVLFGLVGYVGLFVVLLVVFAQFVLKLFTGRINQRLRTFALELSRYYQQIIAFLSLAADEKPYPFSQWPHVEKSDAPARRRRTPGPRRVTLEAED